MGIEQELADTKDRDDQGADNRVSTLFERLFELQQVNLQRWSRAIRSGIYRGERRVSAGDTSLILI
ncbi:hypothetical protein [Haloarcula laminariae]|uniref:hypothetical protein n=1 Tax=Haloarcula laminariae TaxID=2961577 RepID=UPI0021C6CD0C|nr:hypothetical protein [Halomicroarcula laminariae]